MALPNLKADDTEARLSAMSLPAGADAARQDALARVGRMGLPNKRDEYWKYTDPKTLVQPVPQEAAVFHNDEGPLFDAVERIKIVFVDGIFDPDQSSDIAAEGLEIGLSLIHI